MSDAAAIQEQIDAIYEQASKLDAKLWAICSPYEAYTADQLGAMGERLLADAADAVAIQDAARELYAQLDPLYQALNVAQYAEAMAEQADEIGYDGALTA
jgi:hypothetical protein